MTKKPEDLYDLNSTAYGTKTLFQNLEFSILKDMVS